MRAVRRERVKKWHLEKHNFDFEDGLFKPDTEDKALAAIEKNSSCMAITYAAQKTPKQGSS